MFYFFIFILVFSGFCDQEMKGADILSYPMQPALISIEQGDLQSIIVDGVDLTRDVKKLIGYTINWNHLGIRDKSWMNTLFQFDPLKGKEKFVHAVYLFSDGSTLSRGRWSDKINETVFVKPFIPLEARYGSGHKGKRYEIDVTRFFQMGTVMVISDMAIKLEKNISQRNLLIALMKKLQIAKNISLQLQGDATGKPVTFKQLLRGWPIQTTSHFPGIKKEASSTSPQWEKVIATDRLLAAPEVSITKSNPNADKERVFARELPTALKVLENENKTLAVEAKPVNSKKKK